MTRQILSALLVLSSANLVIAWSVAEADEGGNEQTPFAATQESQRREPGPASLEEAIEIALERYGGQATRSETVERDGRLVHEIRVFGDDGIVRTVRIDPDTGEIIPQSR